MTRADLPRLGRWQRMLLIVLAILAISATLLVALQDRLPWSWLPWYTASSEEIATLLDEGQRRLDAGDYEGAKTAFQKILEISPGNAEAQAGLNRGERQNKLAQEYAAAGAAIAEEDWARAATVLAGILAVDPRYADVQARSTYVARQQQLGGFYEDGSQLYDLGQWQEALAKLEQVRKIDPGYRAEAVNERLFVSYLNAAEALLSSSGDDLSSVRQAASYHEKALAIHPRNLIATDAFRLSRLYLDGLLALEQGDRSRAQHPTRGSPGRGAELRGRGGPPPALPIDRGRGRRCAGRGKHLAGTRFVRSGVGHGRQGHQCRRSGQADCARGNPDANAAPHRHAAAYACANAVGGRPLGPGECEVGS